MDLMKKALDEALARNEAETERWTAYRDDQRQAADNMESFRKQLEVDVMVPVGGKALMPGTLYHTNEIFISHSSRMYSQCTAHQAIGVCEHRIKGATERLKALQVEKDMYQNKLDLPVAEGAFHSVDGEQEIIEEYDEAKEAEWRVQHQKRVRAHKLHERAERERDNRKDGASSGSGDNGVEEPIKSDVNVLELLDELEQIEQLADEMTSLQADGVTDEQLQLLLGGELEPISELAANKRVAHQPTKAVKALKSVEKRSEDSNAIDEESFSDSSADLEDFDDGDDVPELLTTILQHPRDSDTTQKELRYLRNWIRKIQLELRSEQNLGSIGELASRSDRLIVCERLQGRIDWHLANNDKFVFSPNFRMLDAHVQQEVRRKRDQNIAENEAFKAELAMTTDEKLARPPTSVPSPPPAELKRSVSFGADEVASFSRFQAPRRVSEDRRNASQLDSDDLSSSDHSDSSDSDTTARLTKLVGTMKLGATSDDACSAATVTKPILKNKQAVQRELHRIKTVSAPISEPTKSTDRQQPASDSEPMVEFNKIIGDIFEKIYPQSGADPIVPIAEAQPVTGVDPLPSVPFRDAHTPKPRVSRFKASRKK